MEIRDGQMGTTPATRPEPVRRKRGKRRHPKGMVSMEKTRMAVAAIRRHIKEK